jgi:hypothetical protein
MMYGQESKQQQEDKGAANPTAVAHKRLVRFFKKSTEIHLIKFSTNEYRSILPINRTNEK